MNAPLASAPPSLTDSELERLDTLLETHAIPHDGMSLEMLDGFLSALVVGPELVMPSEYLPLIWNHEPEWASADEAGDAMRLILGLWNDIVQRLQIEFDEDDVDAHAAAMPLLAYPALPEGEGDSAQSAEADDPFGGAPSDFPLGAAWALGFLRGASLRQEAWDRWAGKHDFVEDDLSMLESLALFSEEQAEELGIEVDAIPDLSDRLDMVADLPAMLQDLQALRLGQIGGEPVRRPDAPGRNDPCPCGSGQKFKKCCGSPQHLH
jgi:uncharacterized protein